MQSKEAEIEQLRLLHAQKGDEEHLDCVNEEADAEREAIIAHLQNRLKITAEEHETFIEKRKYFEKKWPRKMIGCLHFIHMHTDEYAS